MSNYPTNRPITIQDVRRGHIVGKVTDVNQHNSLWLRDALDVCLAELDKRDRVRLAEWYFLAGCRAYGEFIAKIMAEAGDIAAPIWDESDDATAEELYKEYKTRSNRNELRTGKTSARKE